MSTSPSWYPTEPAGGGPTPPGGGPAGYHPPEPYYAPGWDSVPPPRDPHARRRRWRAAVIAVLSVLGVLVVVTGAVGLRYVVETRPLGDVTEPRTATVRQLDVGHCVATLPSDGAVPPDGTVPQDGPVLRVDVVPCTDPHVAEVVGTFEVRAQEWPGQDEVDAQVGASCEMTTAQQAAGFVPVVWSPTEASWRQGDRLGLCLAHSTTGAVTGSFVAGDDVVPS